MIYALVFISFYSNLKWTRENMNHSAKSSKKACFEAKKQKYSGSPLPMFVFLRTKFVLVSDQCSDFIGSKFAFVITKVRFDHSIFLFLFFWIFHFITIR